MDIVTHISALLFTQDKFAIPGFGSFTISSIVSKIGADALHPPTKSISFDDNATADDGILKKFVAKQEKVPPKKVEERIKAFVKASKGILDSGEALNLPKIGRFKLTPDKKIFFEVDEKINYSKENYGLAKIKISPLENTGKRDVSSIAKSQTTKNEDMSKEKTTVNKTSQTDIQSRSSRDRLAKRDIEMPKKKKKKRWIAPLVVIILVGLLSFQVWRTYSMGELKSMAKTYWHKLPFIEHEEQQTLADATIITEDTTATREPIGAEKDIIVNYPNGIFHLIVASFEQQPNAKRFVKQLETDGEEANILESEGYYRISVERMLSLSEAAERLENERSGIDTDIWVLNLPE